VKTPRGAPDAAGMVFALRSDRPAFPGGAVVQEMVHSVFFTVVGVAVTLLTLGLTGVIILLVTNGDTPHTDTRPRATSV
jgi:hypothetical protein